MTKKELKQKMLEYISTLDDFNKDEWWTTERNAIEPYLIGFAATLNIDLTVQSIQIEKE